MKRCFAVFLLCLGFSLAALAQAKIIDDFEGGAGGWKTMLPFGEVAETRFSGVGGDGRNGYAAFRADCVMKTDGLNHLVFYKDVDADLSLVDGLELWVKAHNLPGTRLLAYLAQADGKAAYYPLRDYNPKLTTWQKLTLSFANDSPEDGDKMNFTRAVKIGLMLQAAKPVLGTLFVDDIALTPPENGAWLAPRMITPNDDGVLDAATITVRAVQDTPVTITVQDSTGNVVETVARKQPATGKLMKFQWTALQAKRPVKAGEYSIVVDLGEAAPARLPVTVLHRAPWNPIRPTKSEFMPIGVWFEGSPENASYPNDPAGAKAYYDRSFKEIAAMGFNTVAITWLPDAFWPACLESARRHNLKLMILVPSLFGVIRGSEPLDENVIEQMILNVQRMTKGYEDVVVRYMTKDEPGIGEMERWTAVQRILCSMMPDQPGMSVVCSPGSMREMVASVQLHEAVFDNYPQRKGLPAPSAGMFLGSLKGYRAAAGRLPLWAVVQAFAADSGWRYPVAVELRLSVYQALAAGARGYIFFIYNSVPGSPENIKGLVDIKGEPAGIATEAAALAKELKLALPVLAQFPASSFDYRPEAAVSIGVYARADGKKAVIIANVSPSAAYSGILEINASGAYIDILSQKTYTIENDRIEVDLPAAGAVVLMPGDL